MNKKTILVVDDDPGSLECVYEILARHGYECVLCSETASALDLLASGVSLDLAILDLVMPDMNGLELHRRIKQLRPGLPCIMVTGHSSVQSYLSAINSGIFEYLNKPYGSRALMTIVGAALEKTALMSGCSSERSRGFGVDQ